MNKSHLAGFQCRNLEVLRHFNETWIISIENSFGPRRFVTNNITVIDLLDDLLK